MAIPAEEGHPNAISFDRPRHIVWDALVDFCPRPSCRTARSKGEELCLGSRAQYRIDIEIMSANLTRKLLRSYSSTNNHD